MTLKEYGEAQRKTIAQMLMINSLTVLCGFKCRRDEFIELFISNEKQFHSALLREKEIENNQ